jgi:hypothetical protein
LKDPPLTPKSRGEEGARREAKRQEEPPQAKAWKAFNTADDKTYHVMKKAPHPKQGTSQ